MSFVSLNALKIRRMVGSIIDVGLGNFSYEHVEWLLENPSYQNWDSQQTLAPAKGTPFRINIFQAVKCHFFFVKA